MYPGEEKGAAEECKECWAFVLLLKKHVKLVHLYCSSNKVEWQIIENAISLNILTGISALCKISLSFLLVKEIRNPGKESKVFIQYTRCDKFTNQT